MEIVIKQNATNYEKACVYRLSEKDIYSKVKDLITLSSDYNPGSPQCREFFSQIQNILLNARLGKTAAEIIQERYNPSSPTYGLTTWKGEKPTKADALIAKNYLTAEELRGLELMVEPFLGFALLFAYDGKERTLGDWIKKLEQFLTVFEHPMLAGKGKISRSSIVEKVNKTYFSTLK